MTIRDEEAEAAEALEATGRYKILRRIPKWIDSKPAEGARGIKVGMVVDVETTGLDPNKDVIIEFAAVMFSYGPDGRIYTVSEPYQAYNDPGIPIPAEITELTGITQDMVAGQKLDTKEIDEMFGCSNLCIAFNAAFDRRFCERITMSAGAKKPWACAMDQIPWKAEGIAGRRLEYIASAQGFFYEAHRAVDDCLALVHLLSLPLPKSGKPALLALREQALKPTFRVWAEKAPFDLKDVLKARGYQWQAEATMARPKAWFRNFDDQAKVDAEKAWLQEAIYGRPTTVRVDQVSLFDRFSGRE